MKKKIVSALLAITLSLSINGITSYAYTPQNIDMSEQSGVLRITEGGTYILQGKLTGGVFVDAGDKDVELILDGVDIDGKNGAGIVALSGSKLRITLPEGSVNRVVDSGTDSPYNAAIYSMVETVFRGAGSLYVTGNSRNGINVNNANLIINGGNYAIKADASGITGNNLVLNDGHFSIQAGEGINPFDEYINNGAVVEDLSAYNKSRASLLGFSAPSQQNTQSTATGSSGITTMQENNSSWWSSLGSFFSRSQPEGNMMQNAGQPQQTQNQPVQPGSQTTTVSSSDSPTEIVEGTMTNSAASLEADYDNATYITVTDDDSDVEIKSSGTYVVTGSSSDGNITVKKGTTGVVLVLDDLDLTSTTGATVSINKEAEVKVIISGTVTLTDNENPDDENSSDEAVADAFDGAAIKAKANSQVYVTGDGTLTINGNAKNGIKGGDNSSIIFDGVTMNITATNDGINSNYDVTLLSGNYTISAADDAIHADHILTVGDKDGTGPTIDVTKSNEGLEGTVVNIYGGNISVTSSDDAVNAANGDGVYEGELDYSVNMMGGSLTINSQGDGIDSNGNVNLIGGSARINSASAGGEAGIDYDGELYISDEFNLNNQSGTSGPDMMPGGFTDMGGQMNQMEQPGQMSQTEQPGQMEQMNLTDSNRPDFDQQTGNNGPGAGDSFGPGADDSFGPGSGEQPGSDMPFMR